MCSFFLNFLMGFAALTLPFSTGQRTTKSFHLTDGKNEEKPIRYNAPEECMGNGTADETKKKPLGLIFRLPAEYDLHCDGGLLICYQSYLQSPSAKSFSFQAKGTFIVGDQNNGIIAKECANIMGVDNNANGVNHWHGIKLYTKPTSGPNETQKTNTMLEASVDSKIFGFGPDVHEFSIIFNGGQNDSFTQLLPTNDESFMADQIELQNEFLENVQNSAFLGEFAGFWLLGLDMLPMAGQQTMKLFIYRECHCALEAWFVQPTDSDQPTEVKTPTIGSKECPALATNESFTLTYPDDKDGVNKIAMTFLTDANVTSITVDLANEGRPLAFATFVFNTDADLAVHLGKTFRVNDTRLPEGSSVLKLEIVLRQHYIAIKMNEKELSENIWPKGWGVETWPMEDAHTLLLKAYGEMMLLNVPEVLHESESRTDFLETTKSTST